MTELDREWLDWEDAKQAIDTDLGRGGTRYSWSMSEAEGQLRLTVDVPGTSGQKFAVAILRENGELYFPMDDKLLVHRTLGGFHEGLRHRRSELSAEVPWAEGRHAWTLDDAKAMVAATVGELAPGAGETLKWEPSPSDPDRWAHADLKVGVERPVRFGVSRAGVVQVEGDPFLRARAGDPSPQPLDTMDRVLEATKKAIQARSSFIPAMAQDAPDSGKKYTVSVTYEVVTPECVEAGDAAERGYEIERQVLDRDELKRLGDEYGFSEPSSSQLESRMWFSTVDPVQDRAYIEQGHERRFSLHLNEVDGREPELADVAEVARLLDVRVAGMEAYPPETAAGRFGYYINLDERGDFYADVRDAEGKTVFEVRAGNSLSEDESSLVDDGFMADLHDVNGLTNYLRDIGVIGPSAEVVPSDEFEASLEAERDDGLSIG